MGYDYILKQEIIQEEKIFVSECRCGYELIHVDFYSSLEGDALVTVECDKCGLHIHKKGSLQLIDKTELKRQGITKWNKAMGMK